MDVKIVTIIVTYNGMWWYDKCFLSLKNSAIPVDIVVVDNASSDNTVSYIKEKYPYIKLFESKENLGFGRANNIGMKYALEKGYDYIFLLNQDAWIEHDTIAELVQIHSQHTDFALLSPMHINAEGNRLNFYLDDGARNVDMLSDFYFHTSSDIYTIKYVNAAAWLLPATTLNTIGGFCPIIFHYGEDDDYLNRLRYHGYKVGLCPSARITHDCGKRLDNSESLAKKANLNGMYEFLDINKDVKLSTLKNYYFRKAVLAMFRGNKALVNYNKTRLQILKQRGKEILLCREQHKKLQNNWL